MKYTEKQLKEAAAYNKQNKNAVLHSSKCACYYCCRIFKSSEVTTFFTERSLGGETAICPYCGIDSVLPSSSNISFTEEFLQTMRGYWFDIVDDF